MTRPADAATEAAPGRLILTGQALPKNARGENNTGVRFRAEVNAAVSGGRVESAGDHLDVAGADSVTLTIVAATDYREKDLAAACARDLAAASRAYEALRSEHVADHQRFFRRVRLELPVDAAARALPTDERLEGTEGRDGRRPVRALFPVRKISADRQQPAREHGGQSPGEMERQSDARVGKQVHDQHQHRDELLAGGDLQPVGTARTAVRPDRERARRRPARGEVLLRRRRIRPAPQHRPVGRRRSD